MSTKCKFKQYSLESKQPQVKSFINNSHMLESSNKIQKSGKVHKQIVIGSKSSSNLAVKHPKTTKNYNQSLNNNLRKDLSKN